MASVTQKTPMMFITTPALTCEDRTTITKHQQQMAAKPISTYTRRTQVLINHRNSHCVLASVGIPGKPLQSLWTLCHVSSLRALRHVRKLLLLVKKQLLPPSSLQLEKPILVGCWAQNLALCGLAGNRRTRAQGNWLLLCFQLRWGASAHSPKPQKTGKHWPHFNPPVFKRLKSCQFLTPAGLGCTSPRVPEKGAVTWAVNVYCSTITA